MSSHCFFFDSGARAECGGRIQILSGNGWSVYTQDQVHPMVHEELLLGLHATGRGLGDGLRKACTLSCNINGYFAVMYMHIWWYARFCLVFGFKILLLAQPYSAQVARRPSYKGAAATKVHLPMDSATVVGLVAIFGSILPAQGLTQEALKQCTTTFDALASFCNISETFCVIPELPRMVLHFEENMVKLQSLSALLKSLELQPDRRTGYCWLKWKISCWSISKVLLKNLGKTQMRNYYAEILLKHVHAFSMKWISRILRKLPGQKENKVSISHLLIAMFRARGEKLFEGDKMFSRVLRRLVHRFCQAVEVSMEQKMVLTCPKPDSGVIPKVHPHSKASRLRGNKSLQMSLVEQFQTKSNGFVTSKHMSLQQLGVKDSKHFGSRTTAEYWCRLLAKNVSFCELPGQMRMEGAELLLWSRKCGSWTCSQAFV